MEIINNQNSSKPDNNRRVRLFDSNSLFGDDNEIMIRHDSSIYRLRITRNGKLIMNK
ncbi:MAG: hemin uptake protein HemP [Phycisphaerae bacterium]